MMRMKARLKLTTTFLRRASMNYHHGSIKMRWNLNRRKRNMLYHERVSTILTEEDQALQMTGVLNSIQKNLRSLQMNMIWVKKTVSPMNTLMITHKKNWVLYRASSLLSSLNWMILASRFQKERLLKSTTMCLSTKILFPPQSTKNSTAFLTKMKQRKQRRVIANLTACPLNSLKDKNCTNLYQTLLQ